MLIRRQLLPQVIQSPLLYYFATGHPEHDNRTKSDLAAGGWDTEELVLMGTPQDVVGGHFITFCDQVLAGQLEVRESSQHGRHVSFGLLNS